MEGVSVPFGNGLCLQAAFLGMQAVAPLAPQASWGCYKLCVSSKLQRAWIRPSFMLRLRSTSICLHFFSAASAAESKLGESCNLVDPASSHMLVSKIKPCMSKYKLLYGETANGSLKQLSSP